MKLDGLNIKPIYVPRPKYIVSNLGTSGYNCLEFDEAYHDVGFRIAIGNVNK